MQRVLARGIKSNFNIPNLNFQRLKKMFVLGKPSLDVT